MSHQHHPATASPFRQPKAVWAVAFACVISFMGIGLVDPILPALSTKLHATPSQVSLLFTSYLLVTAVAMLGTNWVSSRIGAKRTLIAGLVLIVAFAGLAGTSHTINGIVGFRAGWGLGNALFIATSLAVIVASASGGFGGAIILYETALGIGIAVGPLLGGTLGGISWRGPFYGVSVLMFIALVATATLVPKTPKPAERTSLVAPLAALRHRGLLIMSLTAVFYNWGFFTMLGYAPYPMRLSEHQLGLVFTGWGLLVAIFSVAVAPRLQQRFGTAKSLYVNLAMLAIVLAVIGAFTDSPKTVIVAVIVCGAFIGINNTLTTQAVMTVAPVPRPVASASYGFVRFIGGGLAPYVAGKLADHFNMHVPFYVGALAFGIAIVVLATGHRILTDAEAAANADEAGPAKSGEAVGEVVTIGRTGAPNGNRPIVVAIDDGPAEAAVMAAAVELATSLDAPLELLHVHEIAVVGDEAVDRETYEQARARVQERLDELADRGVPVSGHILRSVADHGNAGALIASHANAIGAQLVAVGGPTRGGVARLLDGSASQRLIAEANCRVLVVPPTVRHAAGR
ncbi:MFS transporter [Planosporangium thailandense]|uniref:MFS transporter n=1 Tax=Planosporangium thailandense TaxID=765197 RepID=A0ABX0XZP8_9ACTN|nr:MFS transporter [Planosporangium thailandense]NJC71268.1 MFS transporter [Planosporangium thailandense]